MYVKEILQQTIILQRVLLLNMTNTKINRTIYDISKEVNDDQSKIKVKINDKEKLIGISIYNSSKEYLERIYI